MFLKFQRHLIYIKTWIFIFTFVSFFSLIYLVTKADAGCAFLYTDAPFIHTVAHLLQFETGRCRGGCFY